MGKRIWGILLAAAMLVTVLPGNVLTASAAKKKAVCKFSKSKLSMKAGSKKTLKITKKNIGVCRQEWSSSKKSVATVSKKGKITAKKAGTTVIKCKVYYGIKGSRAKTLHHKTLKCTVRVTAKKTSTTKTTKKPTVTVAPTVTPIPTAEVTPAPTLAPTEEPDDPSVTPAQEFAASYKGMDANNPLLVNSFACDPTAIEYNGRVYVYMTNDTQEYVAKGDDGDNTYGYITSIHVISSDDMVNWEDHGTFNIGGKVGVNDYTGVCWAPCMAYKNINGKDKFFLYYTSGGYQIGVAVADSPTGPFRDERKSALLGPQTDNESGADALDPAVFTDDDGKSYLVWGGDCTTAPDKKKYPRIRQLADDMISFVGEEATIEAPYFFEDSGINKIGDKYVFSYCSDWNTRSGEYKDLGLCSIAYMVADSPMGPYHYAGEVLPNCGTVFKKADGTDDSGNNHHSIVKFKDDYYMFYHTMVLRTNMGIQFGGRSTHVNKLTLNDDGTFAVVQQDLKGIEQLKPFNPYQETSGLVSSNNAGMQAIDWTVKLKKKKGEMVLDYVIPTDGARMQAVKSRADYKYSWLSVKGVDFGETTPDTFQSVLKGYGNGIVNMRVCMDSLDGTEIVNTTVHFNEYGEAEISVPANAVTGKHDIFIEFDGSVLSFESWKFAKN